jgi:hypothetical protein
LTSSSVRASELQVFSQEPKNNDEAEDGIVFRLTGFDVY